MEAKLITLLDDGTRMAMVALRASGDSHKERAILAQAGFGPEIWVQQGYVLLGNLNNLKEFTYDEHHWHSRTTLALHRVLKAHWDEIPSGAEVDVRDYFAEVLPGSSFAAVLKDGEYAR